MDRIAMQQTEIQRVGHLEVSKTETIYEKSFDFIEQANQTKSTSFHGALVSKQHFINTLVGAIAVLQELDAIKKALFYGKESNMTILGRNLSKADCNELHMQKVSNCADDGIDILHAIIGKATESGESLEALFDSTVVGKPLDFVNVAEEVGDGQWYDAVLCRVLGFTFEDIQRRNIEKLRARYPHKFTEYDATNRNLSAERLILEKKD